MTAPSLPPVVLWPTVLPAGLSLPCCRWEGGSCWCRPGSGTPKTRCQRDAASDPQGQKCRGTRAGCGGTLRKRGGGGSIRCLTLRPFQSISLSRFHVDNASLFLSKLFWGTVSKKTICVDLLLFHLCNQFSFFLGFPFFVLGPWALKVLWRHVHYSSYSLEITLQYIKVLVLLTDCFSPCQLNQTFNAPSRDHKRSVQSRAQSNGVEC